MKYLYLIKKQVEIACLELITFLFRWIYKLFKGKLVKSVYCASFVRSDFWHFSSVFLDMSMSSNSMKYFEHWISHFGYKLRCDERFIVDTSNKQQQPHIKIYTLIATYFYMFVEILWCKKWSELNPAWRVTAAVLSTA